MEGRVLGGRYEIGRLLGAGGMAEVYEALDQVLDRRVAVKVLSGRYATDPSFLERFRREARAAASMSHPNIVNIFDTGIDDGVNYIVMELVPGRTLRDRLRDGPLGHEEVASVGIGICAALAAAHEAQLVHRDIKPGNIMITPAGQVKVMDFGIVRAFAAEPLTYSAHVIGTAQYLSPEQAQGEQVDGRADLYGLGCCVYEMLTGRVPFTGESPLAIAFQQVRSEAVPPREIDPDIPVALEAITLRAMAKRAEDRFQTAAEMGAAFERARDGLPVTPPPKDAMRPIPGPVAAVTPIGAAVAAEADPEAAGGDPGGAEGRDAPRRAGVWTQTTDPGAGEQPPGRRRRFPRAALAGAAAAAVVIATAVTLATDVLGGASPPTSTTRPLALASPGVVGAGLSEETTSSQVPGASASTRDTTSTTRRTTTTRAPGSSLGPTSTTRRVTTTTRRTTTTTRRPTTTTKPRVTVPGVVGLTCPEAKSALLNAGLRVAQHLVADEDPGNHGVVLGQSPGGGARVTRGSSVTITLGSFEPDPPASC